MEDMWVVAWSEPGQKYCTCHCYCACMFWENSHDIGYGNGYFDSQGGAF